MPSATEPKTAINPSPVVFTTCPLEPSTASRKIKSWRSRAFCMAWRYCSQSRVLPSMSVNRKVSVCETSSGRISLSPDQASEPRACEAAKSPTSRSAAVHLQGATHERSARLQALQSVVRRVFVCLAFGRHVEGAVDEVVDRPAVVQHRLALVDELRCEVAENVHPEQLPVAALEDELHESFRRPSDGGSRVAGEPPPPDLVPDPLRGCTLLREPNHRDLRDRIDAKRRARVYGLLERDPECVAVGHAPLLHGDRSERRRPDDIAGREDPLRARAERLVDDDAIVLIDLCPYLLETEPFRVSRPSRGEQHLVRPDVLAANE